MQIESTSGSYRNLDVQAIAIAVFKDENIFQAALPQVSCELGVAELLAILAMHRHKILRLH